MDLGTSLGYWTVATDHDFVKQGIPSPTVFEGNPMPQFPSLPDPAHLTDLLVRFPKNVEPLMGYINAVLRSDGHLSVAERELIAAYVSGLATGLLTQRAKT